MRIAINATALLSPLTGIGQYVKHLIEEVQSYDNLDLNLFYSNGWGKNVPEKSFLRRFGFVRKCIRDFIPNAYGLSRALQQIHFSHGVTNSHCDIYHEPNFLPFAFRGKTVVTVHDLSWVHYPQMHPLERVRMMNKYFEAGLKSSALIITDSNFVKEELQSIFGIASSKIHPVHLGVSNSFQKVLLQQSIQLLQRYSLSYQHYFLLLGTIEPRKNISVAIEAFKLLPKNIRKKFPLVIAGTYGWNSQDLMQEINNLKLSGDVKYLGYIPESEIKFLVGSATCLIYPSVYEGFGLPVLEAMASEVPVIASNSSSISEVVSEAGILLDPMDISSFSLSMHNMAIDQELRKHFATLGKNRSQYFSWKKCAEKTIDVYQEALR